MLRHLKLALLALPILSGLLGGCIVYDHTGYYPQRHYWHGRW